LYLQHLTLRAQAENKFVVARNIPHGAVV